MSKTKTTKELFLIEELADKKGIDISLLAGIKMLKGWKLGKMITEKEFDQAVRSFLDQPC